MFIKAENIVGLLRKSGLTHEERVQALDKIMTLLGPEIERSIETWEAEYATDPSIRETFLIRFRIVDFIPLAGVFSHDVAEEKLKDRHCFFYRMANNCFASRIKQRLFTVYHCCCVAVIITIVVTI